jgi:hypothetical protein
MTHTIEAQPNFNNTKITHASMASAHCLGHGFEEACPKGHAATGEHILANLVTVMDRTHFLRLRHHRLISESYSPHESCLNQRGNRCQLIGHMRACILCVRVDFIDGADQWKFWMHAALPYKAALCRTDSERSTERMLDG